jgi:hypothetical protein
MPSRHHPLALLVAALLATGGCAAATPPAPTSPGAGAGGVPGFDLRIHPGAAALAAWRAASPYRWVGYYLPAPCHTGRSWLGQRTALAAGGWGLAVLFVGEQDWAQTAGEPPAGAARCTRANLTEAQGRAHGAEADSVTAGEGFPTGTVVFLDVEAADLISAAMLAYVRGWTEGLLEAGRYQPGLYAHSANAEQLHTSMVMAAARAGGGQPPLWVVRPAADFDLSRGPADSGFAWAEIWQAVLDVEETWGGVTLVVDRNVARTADPSRAGSGR